MPEHVGQKLQTIADLFAKAERRVGRHQLAIERLTDLVGQPVTTYLLATAIARRYTRPVSSANRRKRSA